MAEQVSAGGREDFNRLWGKKEEDGRKGPKSFRWGKTISKGLIDSARGGAELLHLSCMGRQPASQPPPPLCNSLPLLPSTSPGNKILPPQRAAPTCSPALPGEGECWEYGCYSCCCHHWWEPCGCHSWPLQTQKLPLAATAAASSAGGGDSLCTLWKNPLLPSLTTRAGGLQPVTTT